MVALWWPVLGAGILTDLQDFGQFLAVLQFQGSIVDALIAGRNLLHLLLQGCLEVKAAQADFIFRHQKHLEGKEKKGQRKTITPGVTVLKYRREEGKNEIHRLA